MTQFDDDAVDELMRLVGAELERGDTGVVYQSESTLAWIEVWLMLFVAAATEVSPYFPPEPS